MFFFLNRLFFKFKVLFGLYVMKRRRENETGNWFSGASTSTVVDGGADGYSAPEYAKL